MYSVFGIHYANIYKSGLLCCRWSETRRQLSRVGSIGLQCLGTPALAEFVHNQVLAEYLHL